MNDKIVHKNEITVDSKMKGELKLKLNCVKIVAEMKKQRLTSSALADKALCSVSTVQAVRNERNVSENSAKRIAHALGMTVEELKEA